MKKLLMLSAALMTLGAASAMAQPAPGEGPMHGGMKHEKGQMFQKHDLDGDGVVSKEEFLKQAEEKFAKIDTNGDGVISKEEAQAAHEKMREKMQERMQDRKQWKEKMAPEGGAAEAPAE
ncbi:MAG: EF-hand domain-containing protein [Alphaproteobacteria bacterium]|nr:EF-hand domain-containing protein [Alphaproteobacteria bacterium]